ncbi:hypothetical protein OIU77_022293 [Salix suchowensis]|uniref:Uncharacterized protein n=1 Tax=Salix suchowensis TaxID=1278906 RepID=A0ABQ9C0J6_9ROSI|nr:hypothetical protein OIU77_022293 [Salix suchowensis]
MAAWKKSSNSLTEEPLKPSSSLMAFLIISLTSLAFLLISLPFSVSFITNSNFAFMSSCLTSQVFPLAISTQTPNSSSKNLTLKNCSPAIAHPSNGTPLFSFAQATLFLSL